MTATIGFIYDRLDGTCLARIAEGGDVIDETVANGAKIATARGNVLFSLSGELLGHLGHLGLFKGDSRDPEALRKLTSKHQQT